MMVNGMLSHRKRYKPRKGASRNWHEAIVEEAFELTDELLSYPENHSSPDSQL